MPGKVVQLQRSFAAGEVAPAVGGRIDLAPYQTGLRLCQNFVTLPQGPAQFRPGMEYFNHCLSQTAARVVPFVYSDDQAYLVEFVPGKIRLHNAGGTLLSNASPVSLTSLTNASPGVLSAAAGAIADGSTIYLQCTGMTEVSGHWFTVTKTSTSGGQDHFTFGVPAVPAISTVGYGVFSGGTASFALEVGTPYTAADLAGLRYVQSADVMTVTSADFRPYELKRTGPNTWTFTAASFGTNLAAPTGFAVATHGPGGGTPVTYNYTATMVQIDGATTVESFAYTPAGSASLDLTIAGNYITTSVAPVVGLRMNAYKMLNGLYGYIGQGDSSFDDHNVVPDLTLAPPNAGPTFSATGDYPRAVTYFQQRRVFAGSVNAPQSVWMTKSGTEYNMSYSVPTRDDDAIAFRIAARELHTIRHLVPMTDLLLFTAGGVWQVVAQNSDVLTPSSVSAKLRSFLGASDVQPVTAEQSVLYAFSRGGRVGEIKYSFSDNGYSAADICLLAPHLFDGYTIVDMALQEVPNRVLWCVRSDGVLVTLTYQPDQKVAAWHQQVTDGVVESVAVLPQGTEDVVYVVVRRQINSQTVRSIERIYGWLNSARVTAFHVDGGSTYSDDPATTIYGLWHLEGQPVRILADGAVHPPRTVANGRVTLEHAASVVSVGLQMTGRLQTLPLSAEAEAAFGQGEPKNVNQVILRLFRTGGVFAGPTFDALTELKTRSTEPYGSPPALKTGEYTLRISPLWGRDGSVCVEQSDPIPLTLLSMAIDCMLGDTA